jgi:hypothetical protein
MAFVLLSSTLLAETPAKEPVNSTKGKTGSSTQQKTTTTGTKSTNTTNTTSTTNTYSDYPTSGASILGTPPTTGTRLGAVGTVSTPTHNTAGTTTDHPTSGASIVGNTPTTGTNVGSGGTTVAPTRTTTTPSIGSTGNIGNTTNPNKTTAGTTGGQGTTGNTGTGNGTNPNVVNHEMNTLDVLREAEGLVSRVPYTYDGHREQAKRDISQAIHKLTPRRATTSNGNINPGAGNSIVPPSQLGSSVQTPVVHTQAQPQHVMSQVTANARLEHALKLLNALHKQVQGENEAAAADVEGAITELQLALKGD